MKKNLSFLGQCQNVSTIEIEHDDRIVLVVDNFTYLYGNDSDLESVAAHALQLHDMNAPERNLDEVKAEIRKTLGLREPQFLESDVKKTAKKPVKNSVKSKAKTKRL